MEQAVRKAVFVGIDWGGDEHTVSVVSPAAQELGRFRIAESPFGYRALEEGLSRYGYILGIAMEATRNMLLLHLLEQGRRVCLINPKASKAWRDTDGVSGERRWKRRPFFGAGLSCLGSGRKSCLRRSCLASA